MYNIRNGAIRMQIPDCLFDGNSNVCAITDHLQDIRKSCKCRKFDLKNEGQDQGEKLDLRLDWIYSIPYR